jgi:WD40 repeat protein
MPPRLLAVRPPAAHTAVVRALAIGPRSGRVFATGADDCLLCLWAIGSDSPLMQLGPFKHPVTCVRFDRSEEILAFGTAGGFVSIVDLDQLETRNAWFCRGSELTCLCLHPAAAGFVVAGDSAGRVFVLSLDQQEPIQVFEAHAGAVRAAAICPGGNFLATTGEDHLIMLFDLTTGKLHGKIHPKCDCTFTSVDFHPTEQILAACAEDRSVKLYDIHRVKAMKGGFVIGQSAPTRICFSQDGEVVAACSPSAVSLFKTSSADHMDHLRLKLKEVSDLQVFERGIVIGLIDNEQAGLLICSTDDFELLLKKKQKKKQKARFASPDPKPPEPVPVKRILDRPPPPPANDAVYKSFRENRAEYVAWVAQRLARFGRLRDLIAAKGLKEAATAIATSGDSAAELVAILIGVPEVISVENASAVLEVVHAALRSDEENALALLRLILRDLGPTLRASMEGPHALNYHACVDILNGLRGFKDDFEAIRASGSPGLLVVKRLLTEWQALFK